LNNSHPDSQAGPAGVVWRRTMGVVSQSRKDSRMQTALLAKHLPAASTGLAPAMTASNLSVACCMPEANTGEKRTFRVSELARTARIDRTQLLGVIR
jgi:hypothetical protein